MACVCFGVRKWVLVCCAREVAFVQVLCQYTFLCGRCYFCLGPFVYSSRSVLHVVVLVVCISVCLHSYCGSLCQACIWPYVLLLCVWTPMCVELEPFPLFEWSLSPSIHSGHTLGLSTVGVDTTKLSSHHRVESMRFP